eukprot:4004742-Amphidinium_carterae.1
MGVFWGPEKGTMVLQTERCAAFVLIFKALGVCGGIGTWIPMQSCQPGPCDSTKIWAGSQVASERE